MKPSVAHPVVETGLDRFGRVIDQRWDDAAGNAMDRSRYTYDLAGNPLSKENVLAPARSELYHPTGTNGMTSGYDALNRLTAFRRGMLVDSNADGVADSVSSQLSGQTWTLDALGNWDAVATTTGTSTVTESRGHDRQNRLTTRGPGSALTYDPAGNQLSDGAGTSVRYDAWGRPATAAKGAASRTYLHDALGRRVTDGTTRFTYHKDWQVLAERQSATGPVEKSYVWSTVYVDALVARDEHHATGPAQFRSYARHDANFNVTSVVRRESDLAWAEPPPEGGELGGEMMSMNGWIGGGEEEGPPQFTLNPWTTERYEYTPYGVRTVLDGGFAPVAGNVSGIGWVYGFQGGRHDLALGGSGWVEFRNRWLVTDQGRWNRQDPLGFVDGSNLYQHVSGQPLSRRDPLGLYDESGHFYTTYMVAIAAGLTPQQAYELAYFSQLPDEVPDYDATHAGFQLVGMPGLALDGYETDSLQAWYTDIQEVLHSLHGDIARHRRQCLAKLLRAGGLEVWERGLLIHALGDSFTHVMPNGRAYSSPLGHALAGHSPDIIGKAPWEYQKYVLTLYESLGGANAGHNALLQSILRFSNTLSGKDNEDLAAVSKLARTAAFGYAFPYTPEAGNVIDPKLGQLSRDQVRKLMDKVKKACKCYVADD